MLRPDRIAPSLIIAAALACLAAPGADAVWSSARAQSLRGHEDPQAEAFVRDEASKVLTILNNRSLSLADKKSTFRAMVEQVADVPRITRFVLGRYSRQITPAQYEAFATAFRAYANNVYESRLGEYRGQSLRVTGSIIKKPGDVVVESEVVGGNSEPAQVNWRVMRAADGAFRAVDVEVAGVWLAITEQQDFVSTLDNHHGDINLLIEQLKRGAAAKPANSKS